MNSPFLPDWVLAHAERNPEAPAVDSPEARLSYGNLAERMRVLAAHLAAAGVRPGDRVLIALPNLPATVVAGLAVHSLGACAVEMNRQWGADAFKAGAAQTRARHAFVLGRDARSWGEVARSQPLRFWVVHAGELSAGLREALGGKAGRILEDGRVDPAHGTAPAMVAPERRPDSPALVLYTSGSIGKPRGVVQTFANIDANTRSIVQYLGLGATDRAMLILPLSYCYGRSVLQTHLFAGGSVFLDNRFMYPRVVLEAMGSEGCTGFAGVPATFEIIRRQIDVSSLALPRLRYLTQAGGAMAPDTIRWVRRAFHPARLFVMYGQSEATSRLSYLPPERGEEKNGSIGIAIPGVELKVVDGEGAEVAAGEVGHLVARGENVTLGYLDAPEETAAILRDGWLWTGDLAYRDGDGFFFHVGRSKEILKIGGHRVSPVEIEHALERHPEVAEAAVVGVKEDLVGEVAAAFVVRRPGAAVTEADLRRFCREQLPAYKVPATIAFVDALPRNEAGKLLRAELSASRAPSPVREEGQGP
ncbi:MAG: acyl--CoA ligase [Deltaproteobacteria bacterium]|jgi:long-chain acyl-CoA synthetase|nr:MAG: acyl--CoA ligase [Deltaproteobacteria bacterium]TMB25175.1 MAG: acyl--CoA ligase [Deltaproteobacteria bacterium]